MSEHKLFYCPEQEKLPEPIRSVYLIGALKNEAVPELANAIEALGIECFADWYSPGPLADDYWRDYSKARGRTHAEALASYAATHIFDFDKHHLDRCDAAVLLMPAGKSGHLELGYAIGKGKPGFILFDKEPERYDIMHQFAQVFHARADLLAELRRHNGR